MNDEERKPELTEHIEVKRRPPRSATHEQGIGGDVPVWREPRRMRILIDESDLPLVGRALTELAGDREDADAEVAGLLAEYIAHALMTTQRGRVLDRARLDRWERDHPPKEEPEDAGEPDETKAQEGEAAE
jgi:hypothetical protein